MSESTSETEKTTNTTSTESQRPVERTDPAVAYTYRGVYASVVNPCGYPAVAYDPNATTFRWDMIINNLACGFGMILLELGKVLSQNVSVIADIFAGIGITTFIINYADRLPFIRNLLSSLL